MGYPFYPENYEYPPMAPDEWTQKVDEFLAELNRSAIFIESWSDLESLQNGDVSAGEMRAAIASARMALDGIERLLTDDAVLPFP